MITCGGWVAYSPKFKASAVESTRRRRNAKARGILRRHLPPPNNSIAGGARTGTPRIGGCTLRKASLMVFSVNGSDTGSSAYAHRCY